MLPVPIDRPVSAYPPWQIQLPTPMVNVPQNFLHVVPNVSYGLASKVYNEQSKTPLLMFAFNLLSSKNWKNENFRAAVDVAMRYLIYQTMAGKALNDMLVNDAVNNGLELYLGLLPTMWPELANYIGEDAYEACLKNAEMANKLLSFNFMAQQQPQAQANLAMQAQVATQGVNLAASSNLAGAQQFPQHANIHAQQQPEQHMGMFSSFMDDEPGVTTTDVTNGVTVERAKGNVDFSSVNFMPGERLPPMVMQGESRELAVSKGKKFWRIKKVDRDTHRIISGGKRAINPLDIEAEELAKSSDKTEEEALTEVIEAAVHQVVETIAAGHKETHNLVVSQCYDINGTSEFSVVSAIVLNSTVSCDKSKRTHYVLRDSKLNGAIPKTLFDLSEAIMRRFAGSNRLIPKEELESFTSYYTELVNRKLLRVFGSDLYIDSFVEEFNDDELYSALAEELPEDVFLRFKDWTSEIIATYKGVKKTGEDAVDNIVPVSSVSEYQTVVAPERYTFIIVDMREMGYDTEDIAKSLVDSKDDTAALRISASNAAHLIAILNRADELSDLSGKNFIVDANSYGKLMVGVEFSLMDDKWVMFKPDM